MKKSIIVFVLLGGLGVQANILQWGTGAGVKIGDSSGIALLNTGAADGVTALVQLVYAGSDGSINEATMLTLNGVTGDDVVVSYAWIGRNLPPVPQVVGEFVGVEAENSYANGSLYYIRAWESVSALAGTGNIPSINDSYGDSITYSITQNTSGNPDVFLLDTGFNTNQTAIPEPAVAGLIGIFGAGMIFVRRLFMKEA